MLIYRDSHINKPRGGSAIWLIPPASSIVLSEFFNVVLPSGTAVLKYWTGSAWVNKPVKYWNGSSWANKPVKMWNGTSWIGVT